MSNNRFSFVWVWMPTALKNLRCAIMAELTLKVNWLFQPSYEEETKRHGKTHSQWSCRFISCFLTFNFLLFISWNDSFVSFIFTIFIQCAKKILEIILIFFKLCAIFDVMFRILVIVDFVQMLSILLLSAFLSFVFLLLQPSYRIPMLKQYETIQSRLEIHGVALTSHFTLIFFRQCHLLCACEMK